MTVLVTNNAWGTLAAGITNVATSITLTTGQGARFPTISGGNVFYATLSNSSNVLEIVQVTATAGDVFTVVRGQDGTTASAYSVNDRIELRPTAALFNSKLDANTPAVGLQGGGAGTIPYQSAAATTAMLAAGTATYVLQANGAAAPSWVAAAPNATNAANTGITDDSATNATMYLTWVTANTGNLPQKTSSTKLTWNPSSGVFSAPTVNATSDRRKKKNIRRITNALELVETLNGVRFEWKENGMRSAGLIAQDVEKVLPELVCAGPEGRTLNYNGVVGVLVEAIKTLSQRVEDLERGK